MVLFHTQLSNLCLHISYLNFQLAFPACMWRSLVLVPRYLTTLPPHCPIFKAEFTLLRHESGTTSDSTLPRDFESNMDFHAKLTKKKVQGLSQSIPDPWDPPPYVEDLTWYGLGGGLLAHPLTPSWPACLR